ncbi:proline and serine-rich 3 [Elysia marginata]|uniref:Proline and serine-rich 3 n=1 Tax=Elysia marginata TaxID=1093978 RepID=A0AAV4F399_9GAST|nr:proline and serine-rich 3 [Elysia marginata]
MFTKFKGAMCHHQKRGDPFSVQPLPKSFYFPSRQKHVDESQAIQTLQLDSSAEGNKNNNNNVYSSTSVSALKILPFVSKVGAPERRDDKTIQFDEVWPDSERPSSPSFAVDITATTDSTGFGETDMNLQGIDKPTELYDWHRYQRDEDVPSEESTLHKYIERFRKSEPKSREERMKEMHKRKQEFWWLQSDAKQNEDLSSFISNEDEEPVKLEDNRDSRNSPYQDMKLTKEALLAMDEATLHLQTKADRLLSKSEISLTSSGPIVSTEGLGTSCSISDQSTVVDAPAYRPAFVNIRENHKGVENLKSVMGLERQVHLAPPAKPDCGDILARWRYDSGDAGRNDDYGGIDTIDDGGNDTDDDGGNDTYDDGGNVTDDDGDDSGPPLGSNREPGLQERAALHGRFMAKASRPHTHRSLSLDTATVGSQPHSITVDKPPGLSSTSVDRVCFSHTVVGQVVTDCQDSQ